MRADTTEHDRHLLSDVRAASQRGRGRVGDVDGDERARRGDPDEVHGDVLPRAAAHQAAVPAGALDQHLDGGARLPRRAAGRSGSASRPRAARYARRATSGGTASGSAAAAVPGRGEKTNVKAASNPAASTRCRVSSKSSSVSPGKPTMRSVVIAMSGTAARKASTLPRYQSMVYPRPMAASTLSEPDWAGRWTCSQTVGSAATASISSSDRSRGCEVVNRRRRRPATSSRLGSSPAKVGRRGARKVVAVGVDVLAEQGDFEHAVARQRAHLGDDVGRPDGCAPDRERPARCSRSSRWCSPT